MKIEPCCARYWRMARPSKPGVRRPAESAELALRVELAASRQDAVRDLRLVSSQVGISILAGLKEPVTVPDFLKLKALALIDLFWGLDDPKAAVEVEVTLSQLAAMREHPATPVIREELE